MRPTVYAAALGSALLLAGSWPVGAQDALFTTERDCTADVWALCARVMPGGGRVFACLHLHAGKLSVGCSAILSSGSWTAKECANDIMQFCHYATFGNISNCLKLHLDEASASCKSALAFIAFPTADRN